jgi:hypothetical protein
MIMKINFIFLEAGGSYKKQDQLLMPRIYYVVIFKEFQFTGMRIRRFTLAALFFVGDGAKEKAQFRIRTLFPTARHRLGHSLR